MSGVNNLFLSNFRDKGLTIQLNVMVVMEFTPKEFNVCHGWGYGNCKGISGR